LQGVFIICSYTAVITYVILKVLNMFTEVRVTNEQEDIGLDMSEHNEQGYSL
jgi:Amt family ammonium transporter